MSLRLTAILAHPDDESLGFGGALAKYAQEGVETSLVTATRGERGRFRGHPATASEHPGQAGLAAIRERELRAASAVLGIRDVTVLDYEDQQLDEAPVAEVIGHLARHIRRLRPDIVLTFPPDGAYGHPDHIAISQFTTAAIVAAADPDTRTPAASDPPPHRVAKLYYLAWDQHAWAAYQEAFRDLVANVDGVVRQAAPWPAWAITTVIDTASVWPTVWQAVSCHESQITAYERLARLSNDHHRALWGSQSYYRALSLVNGGRRRESDLFEGLR